MNEPSLLIVSLTAFLAVIVLLAVLAGAIRVLMALFPEKPQGGDDAMLAAIHAAAALRHPGMRITRIEELR
jgi:hypothetical protein